MKRLEEETRVGKGGTLAGQLSPFDLVVLDQLGLFQADDLDRAPQILEAMGSSAPSGSTWTCDKTSDKFSID